jgi:hypothetical protein
MTVSSPRAGIDCHQDLLMLLQQIALVDYVLVCTMVLTKVVLQVTLLETPKMGLHGFIVQ